MTNYISQNDLNYAVNNLNSNIVNVESNLSSNIAGVESNLQENIINVSKMQGPQGPQGPKGDQGIKGDQGDKGTTGDKGDKGDKGDTGTNGINGTDGTNGQDGNIGGLSFNQIFDTNTTSSNPGSGKIKFNESNQNTSTELYVNRWDKYTNDISTIFETLQNVSNDVQKGFIIISKLYDPNSSLTFSISNLTNNTGWYTLDVIITSFSDDSPFVNSDNIIISFSVAGGGGFTNYINIRSDGISLSKGDLIYASGTHTDDRILAKKADATDSNQMPCIGICNQNLNSNQNGLAITYGKIKGVDTAGHGFSLGDIAYVSNTTPGQVNSKPLTNTDLIQNVGIVTKVATNGTIFVTGVGRANDIPNSITLTSFDKTENYIYTYNGYSERFNRLLLQNIGTIAKQHDINKYSGEVTGEIIYDTSTNKLKFLTASSTWETITSSA